MFSHNTAVTVVLGWKLCDSFYIPFEHTGLSALHRYLSICALMWLRAHVSCDWAHCLPTLRRSVALCLSSVSEGAPCAGVWAVCSRPHVSVSALCAGAARQRALRSALRRRPRTLVAPPGSPSSRSRPSRPSLLPVTALPLNGCCA